MLDEGNHRYDQDQLFENSEDELDQLQALQNTRWPNPLQEHNEQIYAEDLEEAPVPNKPSSHNLHKFLVELDQNHDSEDQGIEDYKIGGYHPVHIGEVLINRYVVIQKLGWGHFSTVWLCKDFKYDTYVAVKIQKSSPHYMEAAFDEVQILQKVQKHHRDPRWQGTTRDDTHVVSLLNSFIHKSFYGNHFCMVFEILRCNLLDILKRYNYEGLPMDICQEICRQVLVGLDYLHRICGVIHTDLKPENVMVCLSAEEIQDIVENGQLTKNQLFAERTETFQKMMGIEVKPKTRPVTQSHKQEKIQYPNMEGLTKNQKKNLKKKLKKKLKKEKENTSQITETLPTRTDTVQKEEELPKTIDELFDLKKGKIVFNRGQKLKMPFKVKIADLGNACWKHHHFSTEIQTRQYRSPQVIIGQTYNESSDIWSLACMMYEMLTGDLLFQPRKGATWSKNDDHLAQMQELLGPFDPNFSLRGKKSKKYFTKQGLLKRVPELQFWPIDTVLKLKHKIKGKQAKQFADFLQPMLIAEPQRRITARDALKLQWFSRQFNNDIKMSDHQYEILKLQFNQMQTSPKQAPKPYINEDADGEDNDGECGEDFGLYEKGGKRLAEINLVDRSFTDLGYIGYCDGICLEDLDSANWQFSLADV